MPATPKAKPESKSGTEYRYMGNHATELAVGDGLPWLEPGEIVVLTEAEAGGEKAGYMVREGILVDTAQMSADLTAAEEQAQAEAAAAEEAAAAAEAALTESLPTTGDVQVEPDDVEKGGK